MKKVTMLVLAISLVFCGVGFAQNIIGNPGVEDLSPAFWNPLNGTFGSELGVGTDAADVETGFRSFKITKSAATSGIVGWLSDDNANKYWNNAGTGTFAISVNVKTVGVNTIPANDDAKIGALFEFKNAAGVELSSATLWADQSAAGVDWTNLSDVVILSEAPEQVFVTLFMGKDATGTVYFDQVSCNTADSWSMGIFNGGAENGAGWMDWYGGNGNYTMVTDAEAHSGDYSIVLYQDEDLGTDQSELVYYTQPYAVEAGEWYQVGAWVKTEEVNTTGMGEFTYATDQGVDGGINLCYFFHKNDIETSFDSFHDTFVYVDQRDSTTGWIHYVVVDQAPEDATGISVRARFNNWVTGTAYFDDFSVVKMAVAPTAIEPENEKTTRVPEKFALLQNYPNPFNPETTIEYALPKQSKVTLTIYNVLGQQVRTLTNTVQNAGNYSIVWDAKNNHGEAVPTGMYLYVLSTNEQRMTRKMVLMR
ncbi:MAG: FlgD immunoglobulin-like domain containing protein [bacterium]